MRPVRNAVIVVLAGAMLASISTLSLPAAGGVVSASSSCAALRRGGGPGDVGYLAQADAGKRVCVRVGQQFAVYLHAPSAKGPDWAPINRSSIAFLAVHPNGVRLARGETGANYLARKPGTTKLSSTRHVCGPAPPGGVTCFAIELWSATVVVLAKGHSG